MKKFIWFTHTNIDIKNESLPPIYIGEEVQNTDDKWPDISFNLTKYLDIFKQNEIWNKNKYRTDYTAKYSKEDIEKITSFNITIHNYGSPFSNTHNYENILSKYINLNKIELRKIASSGIEEASKIAVIAVEFDSENKVIDYLTYEEEKRDEVIFEKLFGNGNIDSWHELNRLKSLICEVVQFFMFSLHINYPSQDYEFSFYNKPDIIGFTTVSNDEQLYYETDKINFLSHYIFYEKKIDMMEYIMEKISNFWHKDNSSIHFFLDALKGNYITATNFTKLVFTVESFFAKNTSNDFITLAIPLILGKDIHTMKSYRDTLRKCFNLRNEIVHGNKIFSMEDKLDSKPNSEEISKLFFKLKNIVIYLLAYYIENNLFNKKQNIKINHELIFELKNK